MDTMCGFTNGSGDRTTLGNGPENVGTLTNPQQEQLVDASAVAIHKIDTDTDTDVEDEQTSLGDIKEASPHGGAPPQGNRGSEESVARAASHRLHPTGGG